MTVYVDNMEAPYGRMIMCHMFADSLDELHAMADAIGVKRKWFQKRRGFPHYDICKSKRKKAVELGAVEIEWRQLRDIRLAILNAGGFGEYGHAPTDKRIER